MRLIELKSDKTILFGGKKAEARWSIESNKSMEKWGIIDVRPEIVKALVDELNFQFKLTDEEKDYAIKYLTEYL